MRIDIITIFPKMFETALNESIVKRAKEKSKVEICIHNLRDYSGNKHKKVDDYPFGGGSGMVMNAGPMFKAVEDIKLKVKSKDSKGKSKSQKSKIILLCPQGKTLKQEKAKQLAKYKHLILICGHYEGVDERVREYLVDEQISIGDYVLTGGELPAMVLVDCVVRLLPGVLGDKNSLKFESFEGNLLEYPQYTRPADFRGMKVPGVLLSGNHKEIEQWRNAQAVGRTKQKRPDLLTKQNKRGAR